MLSWDESESSFITSWPYSHVFIPLLFTDMEICGNLDAIVTEAMTSFLDQANPCLQHFEKLLGENLEFTEFCE